MKLARSRCGRQLWPWAHELQRVRIELRTRNLFVKGERDRPLKQYDAYAAVALMTEPAFEPVVWESLDYIIVLLHQSTLKSHYTPV